MTPASLKRRVALLLSLSVAVAVAAISLAAYMRIRSLYLGHLDRMLEIMANGVQTKIVEPRENSKLDTEVRQITQSPWKGTGTHFRIWQEGGELAASVRGEQKKAKFLYNLPASERPATGESRLVDLSEHKKEYRAVWSRHATPHGEIDVVIAHPSNYEHRRLDEFVWMMSLLGAGLVLATFVLAGPIARLAIRPIAVTAASLSRVTHQNFGTPQLDRNTAPPELLPFVDEVSLLLARLEKAMQRQIQFTADASHELRTPLTLAQSSLQLARSKSRSEAEYRQAIDDALGDLVRIEAIIGQLLALAQMDETGRLQDAADVRIDVLLYAVTGEFEKSAALNGARLVCEATEALTAHGSEPMLRRLFNNLIANALNYGPPGGTVRVKAVKNLDGLCTVTVHDEGGSIKPDDLAHLFDRFYRAEPSRNRNSGGAGLGLPISREIARCHGGDIRAESNLATGTTFTVTLRSS